MSRPQPRRSAYLSHSHFPSDAVPRVPAHSPPTLHPLSSDRVAAVTRENDSFTFHTSSCSEAELESRNATHLQGEHSAQQTLMESSTLMALGQNQPAPQFYRPHNPLSPHTPFERPKASTRQEYVGCHGATGTLPEGQGQGAWTVVDLTSRSVQMEIVQMRDELKRFHDLKLHHKQLEAQLTARLRQGGSEAVAQVQQTLFNSCLY